MKEGGRDKESQERKNSKKNPFCGKVSGKAYSAPSFPTGEDDLGIDNSKMENKTTCFVIIEFWMLEQISEAILYFFTWNFDLIKMNGMSGQDAQRIPSSSCLWFDIEK